VWAHDLIIRGARRQTAVLLLRSLVEFSYVATRENSPAADRGTRMLPGNLATVAVRPAPRLIAGQLSAADMQAVSEWVRLNEAALVAYWEYQISAAGLMQQLRRLP